MALEQLLQLRRPSASGAGAAGAGDDGSEDLMAVAKATGKELYSGLAPTQRIERINKMVGLQSPAVIISFFIDFFSRNITLIFLLDHKTENFNGQ